MVHQSEIELSTRGGGDMHDLTREVAHIVAESGVRAGIVHVFNVGSTGAIGTIEFEPGLVEDLPTILNRLMPPSRQYGHERTWHDGNGHSCRSVTAGSSSEPGSRSSMSTATSRRAGGG